VCVVMHRMVAPSVVMSAWVWGLAWVPRPQASGLEPQTSVIANADALLPKRPALGSSAVAEQPTVHFAESSRARILVYRLSCRNATLRPASHTGRADPLRPSPRTLAVLLARGPLRAHRRSRSRRRAQNRPKRASVGASCSRALAVWRRGLPVLPPAMPGSPARTCLTVSISVRDADVRTGHPRSCSRLRCRH
jgi:hypothetical protein